MTDATIDLVYNEIKKLRKEVHELRMTIVPEEKISTEENKEVDGIIAAMKKGESTNWRDIKK